MALPNLMTCFYHGKVSFGHGLARFWDRLSTGFYSGSELRLSLAQGNMVFCLAIGHGILLYTNYFMV